MIKISEEKTIGFEIKTVSNLIKRKFDKSSTKQYVDNLTRTHGWIIGYLYKNLDKDIFQKDLENKFSIRRSTATGILKLMEKNDLIYRESVSYDARLKKIVLTEKALEIHKMILKDIKELNSKLTNNLTEEEIKIFFSIIDKIKRNLE